VPAQFVGLSDERTGVGQERRAGYGQGHRPAIAVEEGDLEIALEGFDLLGQRRPGDVESFGRTAAVPRRR
jgi:hypothetical protein